MLRSATIPLIALAALGPTSPAEPLGPGSYRGWVSLDRWGELQLANGVYLLPVAKESQPALRPHLGHPVDVDVTRMEQPNDFDALIATVGGVKPATPVHDGNLKLALTQGRGKKGATRFEVRLQYDGNEPVELRLRDLRVLLRRRGPPCRLDEDYADAADAHGTRWGEGGMSTRVLVDERLHENLQVFRAPGGDLEARGPFTYTTALHSYPSTFVTTELCFPTLRDAGLGIHLGLRALPETRHVCQRTSRTRRWCEEIPLALALPSGVMGSRPTLARKGSELRRRSSLGRSTVALNRRGSSLCSCNATPEESHAFPLSLLAGSSSTFRVSSHKEVRDGRHTGVRLPQPGHRGAIELHGLRRRRWWIIRGEASGATARISRCSPSLRVRASLRPIGPLLPARVQ